MKSHPKKRSKALRSHKAFRRATVDRFGQLALEPLENRQMMAVFSNPGAITIPDLGDSAPYPSTIDVPQAGIIQDVNVTLNLFSHTFPDDVDIMLVAPTGESAIIMSDVGGKFDAKSLTITLDDEAGSELPDGLIIVAGPSKPTNVGGGDLFSPPAPATSAAVALSTFDGLVATGTWKLFVVDDNTGGMGSIAGGWSIDVTSIVPMDEDVVLDGTNADDVFVVKRIGPNLRVTRNDVIVFDEPRSGVNSLTINGLAGNDSLIVDSGNGLVDLPNGIRFHGGTGFDRLDTIQSSGAIRTSSTIAVGPTPGSGRSIIRDGGSEQRVDFQEVEPVVDVVPAATFSITSVPGIASLLDAANAINYKRSEIISGGGRVTVDHFEPIEFNNKDELVLDARAGSDEINLNNPNRPDGANSEKLETITINGNDPTASDTLIVNSSTDEETITYTPTSDNAGSVSVTGQPLMKFTTVEHLVINGQGGGDELIVDTRHSDGIKVLTPGTSFDSGSIDFLTNTLNGGFTAPSLRFLGLGTGGSLAIVDGAADPNPNDDFVYRGTALGDTFTVTPDNATTGVVVLNNQIPVSLSEVGLLTLAGLDGDDRFNVNPGATFRTGVTIEGGNPSGSDIATLNGSGAADDITFTLGAAGDTVTGVVGGPVTLVGTEVLNLNGLGGSDTLSVNNVGGFSDLQSVVINSGGNAGDTLSVTGTSDDDTIIYTPTGANSGDFFEDNAPTKISFLLGPNSATPTSTFTVHAGQEVGDMVVVKGTNNADFISVDSPKRTVTVENAAGVVLKPVILGGTVEEVTVQAGFGNDTVLVIPKSATETGPGGAAEDVEVPINLLINVDGGAPSASDALVIADDLDGEPLPDSDFVVINRSRTPDEGVVRVFHNAEAQPDITFTNVEIVSPIVNPVNAASGNPNVLVLGPDLYEQNEFRATASFLGSASTINLTNLAIFPNADEHRFVPADQDWFRVVAQKTGTLDFQIYFRKFNTDLLPEGGNLDIEVRDSSGTLITGFGENDDSIDERVRIPVVAGQSYYVRVFGGDNENGSYDPSNLVVNGYSMTIINEAPPVPFDLELDDVIGSSEVTGDRTKSSFKASTSNSSVAPFAGLNRTDDYYVGKLVNFLEGPAAGERAVISNYKVVDGIATFTLLTNLAATPNAGDDFIVESVDTGRSQLDNTTHDNTPVIFLRLDDGIFLNDLPGNGHADSPPDEVIPIPYSEGGNTPGYRIAIFDEGNTRPQNATAPQTPIGYARQIPGQEGVYVFDFDEDAEYALTDGSHFITARVQIIDPANPVQRGFGGRSASLEVVVDTGAPPLFFGLPAVSGDGLDPASDTGVAGQPATFSDSITSDTTPKFFGTAEANSIIRLYIDRNDNQKVDNNDLLISQTVATPIDGTNQLPGGRWVVASNIDLNDPNFGLAKDGVKTIMATAEDLAGNITPANAPAILEVFIDTSGPRVRRVTVTGTDYELFDPKPSEDGPSPLINQIDIHFLDQPGRKNGFVFPAVNERVAETIGNYVLLGDHTGRVLITDARLLDESESGDPGKSIVRLTFDKPLADDRFTLTVLDNLIDDAGNHLDGESQASSPFEGDTQTTLVFPSGDGQPGGDFVARFTVDTRPEIGTYAAGSIFLDINGNLVWDFEGQDNDTTNKDLVFTLGVAGSHSDEGFNIHDGLFAGNFASGKNGEADGFDKLAAYGFIDGHFRWIIDTNNDGVIDTTKGDFYVVQPNVGGFNLSALPFAGDFDPDHEGDEIGLFDGSKFLIDTNGNNRLDSSDLLINSTLRGTPIVGDFDGDGREDLATWRVDQFSFDLRAGGFGNIDATIDFGFPGVAEKPVAADMDHDGITDIGLFVPRRSGTTPEQAAEWYFLLSNDFKRDDDTGALVPANHDAGSVETLDHPFSPIPLGRDLFAQFGDEFALPIVGNFDPPVAGRSANLATGTIDVGMVHAAQQRTGVSINGDRWLTFETSRGGSPMINVTGAAGAEVQLFDADLNLVDSNSGSVVALALGAPSAAKPPAQYFVRVVGASSNATVTISNQLSQVDQNDVNRDGRVEPSDLLKLIDSLNRRGIRSIDFGGNFAEELFYDTTLDGQITPQDSLLLIDYLNRQSLQSSVSLAGESSSGFLGSFESSNESNAEVSVLLVPTIDSTASTPATKSSSQSTSNVGSPTTTAKVSGSAAPTSGGYLNRVTSRGRANTAIDAALADEDDWLLLA